MDQTLLAASLVASDDSGRQSLLASHTDLVNIELAWGLKSLYDEIESSDPEKAAEIVSTLTALSDHTNDSQIRAISNWAEGLAAVDSGELETAVSYLDISRSLFLKHDQHLQAAFTQVSMVRALAMLGRFDEALQCGQQARDVFVAHRDFLSTGKIEQNLGNLHFMLDNYIKAEHLYRSARERFEVIGDQKQLAQVDNCLATTLTSQYRFHEAENIYAIALARAEAANLEVTLAEIETNQGCLALYQGQYDRALEYLERSRRRYAALGMPHNTAIADQELADAYLESNLIPEAVAIYERVIPVFAELGMQTEHARARTYLARAYFSAGQVDQARTNLTYARALYQTLENPVGEATVGLIEAEIHLAEADHTTVIQLALETETVFVKVSARGRILQAHWLQAEADRALGNSAEAQSGFENILYEAEHWKVLPVIQRCCTSLGLLAFVRGDVQAAELAFKQAIRAIEDARAPLPAEEFRTAFLTNKLTPYTELVRICLVDGSPTRLAEALGYVERARSRALLDMVTGAMEAARTPKDEFDEGLLEQIETLREELNWFYSQINRPDSDVTSRGASAINEYYTAIRERELAISEINLQMRQRNPGTSSQIEHFDLQTLQADLGAETTLVEYFRMGEEWLAFVVTQDGIEVVHLPCDTEEVTSATKGFHFQLGTLHHGLEHLQPHLGELEIRARNHLRALYQLLIAPIRVFLGTKRLMIVPQNNLHYVPFHALHDGSRYLIEEYEVCCVPSASILHHCMSVPHRPIERATLLGIADERNPRVRNEILALAPLFRHHVTLLNDQATRASLYEHSPTADVLHLACHGRFRPDNPMFSSLQLSDGWLTVREAYRLNLTCELVTLSACETGVSAFAPGDEWLGLARSFFAAGAPSLLVSQWTVDDEATEAFMKNFYSSLQAGATLSAAHRNARCALMLEKPHPYFWAPFVLLGRW